MTGISQTVTLEGADANARLQLLLDRMSRPIGFYKNVGELLLNSTRDNFAREQDPYGNPWKPLKERTIRQREREGLTPITILRARGRLAGSINVQASDEEVRIGSPMEYAAVHQLGDDIEIPERTQTIYQHYDAKTDTLDQKFRRKSKSNFARDVTVEAHTIHIDARPYLGISAEDEAAILGIAEEWLRVE